MLFSISKQPEKGLQFGIKKCKSMLIGENTKNVINSKLLVDKWSVEHREDVQTGETELYEEYCGQVEIDQTNEQKYLGFVISHLGDNMANIRAIKNKSIGIIRKIFTKLNSLKLKNYYFECALILMNTMLRPCILYASETYYNLKEMEIRQLERIEESFMRQMLKTKKGCPINQIYLELGQQPARFSIYKIKLFFLKYILDQENSSSINQFYNLQVKQPTKNDWASSCLTLMNQLQINLSTKMMSEKKFKDIVITKSIQVLLNT